MHETPNLTKRKFLYRLSRSDYEKEWGKDYTKPGIGTRVLSILLRYIPKIGPFKALAFNNPTPQTEDLYFKSIHTTIDQYRAFLEEARTGSLLLPNRDLDTGNEIEAAEYSLTDDTYAILLAQLTVRKFDLTTSDLRDDILHFYSDLSAAIETKKNAVHWQSLLKERMPRSVFGVTINCVDSSYDELRYLRAHEKRPSPGEECPVPAVHFGAQYEFGYQLPTARWQNRRKPGDKLRTTLRA